jgi:hypothetical protein
MNCEHLEVEITKTVHTSAGMYDYSDEYALEYTGTCVECGSTVRRTERFIGRLHWSMVSRKEDDQ